MPQQGRLKVHGEGEIEVELVSAYLTDLKRTYDSIILFEAIVDGIDRASRDFPFPRYPFGLYPD